MPEAWAAYDRLFADERIAFLDETPGLETRWRKHSQAESASPKLWADAWLLAVADAAGAAIVTFDRALAARAPRSILLA